MKTYFFFKIASFLAFQISHKVKCHTSKRHLPHFFDLKSEQFFWSSTKTSPNKVNKTLRTCLFEEKVDGLIAERMESLLGRVFSLFGICVREERKHYF
jgi:hypothetical protein